MPARYRRSYSRPGSFSGRRRPAWADFRLVVPAIPVGMGAVVDLLADYGVAGLTHEGITVVRTHIRMNFGYATAADVWSWGLSVVRLTDIGTQSPQPDRKSTRLNSSHLVISYAVFCLK